MTDSQAGHWWVFLLRRRHRDGQCCWWVCTVHLKQSSALYWVNKLSLGHLPSGAPLFASASLSGSHLDCFILTSSDSGSDSLFRASLLQTVGGSLALPLAFNLALLFAFLALLHPCLFISAVEKGKEADWLWCFYYSFFLLLLLFCSTMLLLLYDAMIFDQTDQPQNLNLPTW